MGHQLTKLGSASLDTMGGLIAFASARDIPEGASPRNWDVDFQVGSVYTRPGLVSEYTYATTIQITGYALGSGGLATFQYIGVEPTINEGFFLNGFQGVLSVLNGQEVFVEAVDMTTFMAQVNGPLVTLNNLTASAVSATGIFVGPNVGSVATSTAWSTPTNIFSATAYTSATSGSNLVSSVVPGSAANASSPNTPWSSPQYATSTNTNVAYISGAGATQYSAPLFASALGLSLPLGATVTGLKVAFQASAVNSGLGSASPSIAVQLALGSTPLGTPVSIPIASNHLYTPAPYSYGSSTYQWGTTPTAAVVDDPTFGIILTATLTSGTSMFNYDVNNLVVTVYYTTANMTEVLTVTGFAFAVPLTSGVSGFTTTFQAWSSASTSLVLQLLQAGLPVGTPKTVQLTTTPTVYSIGGPDDPWGDLWSAANVNSVQFGIQLTAEGVGTTYASDLDITTSITPALTNFNWIGSYEQNNMALTTLALDANGIIWKEDVINNPGVLSVALSGILPGSFAVGSTIDDSEFIMFSDLSIGTERPRQLYNDGNWYPVTQQGPSAPPTFAASTGSISGVLQLNSYTWSAPDVAGFTFAAVATAPTVGSMYTIAGTGTALDGKVVIVLSSPAPTITTFSAAVPGPLPSGPTTIVGTLTPQFSYSISSITQTVVDGGNPYVNQAPQLGFLLGSAPATGGTGSTVTVWYNVYPTNPWPALVTSMANPLIGTYIYITGAISSSYDFNGIWQVTAIGQAHYPGTSDTGSYLCFTYVTSGTLGYTNIHGASIFLTSATLTLGTPVASLVPGTQITITGATPSGWNNTWVISQALNNGAYNINTTQYDGAGVATYGWSFAGANNIVPVVGNLIEVTGATNNAGFNGTFVIASTPTGSTFTVNVTIPIAAQTTGPIDEGSAQAIMFGTVFTFDPGEKFVGTNTDVDYGNDTTGTGSIFIIGSNFAPIGAGTRQAVVFFITATGAWTQASTPYTFTTSTDANLLNVSNIPIGPPDVVARGIAITEAGANGVPGANFYVITVPVTVTVGTTVTTYSSTIINDNTSTSTTLSFTDAVLLNSQEVDIPGFNLFNLIELGSSAWCVPYSSRMFYGLQLNKVQNFIPGTMSFDGGYLSLANPQPLGWGLSPTANETQLVVSPVTGDAYYVSNTTGSIQTQMGMITQSAYQDYYNVAIINANVGYSVRVSCSCPSGVRLGTLVIDLTDISGGVTGRTYGSFTVPFADMGTTVTTFSGVLLNKGIFIGLVSKNLQLRVWEQNMGVGADVLIDRIEVYPTAFPYLKTEVYGSYINKPEAVDASGDGGIIDTSTENAQPCMGGFVMRDQMYLLKTSSMYSVRDNPNSEPGGWSLLEVSNRVGSVGINAFDVGEEWAVTACRSGIFGFNGGEPKLINLEILPIWNAINWAAGNTICLRNEMDNRRILCAIPLPTGTSPEGIPTATVQWLPYAAYNPAPTTPNVMLMLNYKDIGSFDELVTEIGTRATMFGTLSNPDMRRKWSIWQIPTPYMGMVLRENYISEPLYICNGIDSSKIYTLDDNQLSDDGSPIYGLYTTYGFVNAVKATTIPLFGMHTKRYTVLQFNAEGAGNAKVRLLPNVLDARYPYSIPGGVNLVSPAQDDYFRSINAKGQRMFFEISTNAVGSWFNLCKVLLTGKQDAHSSLNPTGGGSTGIVA